MMLIITTAPARKAYCFQRNAVMVSSIMQVLMFLCVLTGMSVASTSCPNRCKCFTTVHGISAVNCTDIPTAVESSGNEWPQKVLRIHFKAGRTSPIMLKDRIFKPFPRLTFLDITGHKIGYVGSLAFDGLPELVELNLINTNIRKLDRNTFAGNSKLAFLSLKKNHGVIIGPSFLISNSITELDISECGLKTLKSVYFNGLPNLKYLFASKNELRSLGFQFGPSSLKYVNLAHNHITDVEEDLESYKRLRTIDLTGNPINCTCELVDKDRILAAKGVALGNTINCVNTGRSLNDMIEACSDKDMMGDDAEADIYKADNLLKIDNSTLQEHDDFIDSGSGSGSGDGENDFVNKPTQSPILTTQAAVPEVSEATPNKTQVLTVQTALSENQTDIQNTIDSNETAALIPVTENPITLQHISETHNEPETPVVPKVELSLPVEPTAAEDQITTDKSNKPPVDTVTESHSTTKPVETATKSHSSTPETNNSSSNNGIVPQTIQAPEDEKKVPTKITEYLKSNTGITATAAVLAIVIIAIIYKAVCSGHKRNHGPITNEKNVELKDIKYMPADTEDCNHHHDDTPTGSVEDNLLEDHDSDDEDYSISEDVQPSRKSPTANGHATSGLLNSSVDAPNNREELSRTSPNSQDRPTKVIVKMAETPKAQRPCIKNFTNV
ncbi:uncharacterized protein LOC126835668 [Adelges cooleyi]|uniref:uncharacterized protein LOC126835668 n=1 Tax=Adelges cooleyi TaxID=133065 RepID=UPI0021808699|nr:uncharacterized protein LOC126835668 [Adelges cooleyi]